MSWKTPRDWYRREGWGRRGLAALALNVAAAAWTWRTARRLADATPVDPGLPVICVGNLTAGGAGKTPVVRALAARLVGQGVAAHILARGHGGRLTGPARVDPARHTAAEVGDEPLMMAPDSPVWIARDRAAGAAAAKAAGAAIVVMDDGHQNPALAKALSLIVVDAETRDGEWPFGDGRVLPAGPMREPLAAGLARADAVILLLPADLAAPDPGLMAAVAGPPTVVARLAPIAPPPAGPQIGFAGLGKPWKFERALRAAGCDVVDFAPLADHAPLSERLLGFLAARAAALGAGLVTTEKDWARLSPAWRERVAAWPVRVRFDDEATLDALLAQALGASR